jgi:hypothetical protein
MKNILALSIVLSSAVSFAHIEVGTHEGATTLGNPCTMIAGEQTFLNNQKHPLNERIEVTVEGQKFEVQHPPVIELGTETAFFNHDAFQGVVATKTGAKALWIVMSHAEGNKGPVAYTLIDHNWKTGEKTSVFCNNLKFSGK